MMSRWSAHRKLARLTRGAHHFYHRNPSAAPGSAQLTASNFEGQALGLIYERKRIFFAFKLICIFDR